MTQTPPQNSKRYNGGKKGDNQKTEKLNREMEQTLRRYEEELWSHKTPEPVICLILCNVFSYTLKANP